MNDSDRTQNPPSQPNRSNATQNGAPTTTRARIDQIRDRINQLQEEKELELLILQLHDLEQELAHLRARRRSLPNHANRYRTRSPIQRQTPAPQTQNRRSRSPDRMIRRPGLSNQRDPAATAALAAAVADTVCTTLPPANSPESSDPGISSPLDMSDSLPSSETESQSPPPLIKTEPTDSNPTAANPGPQRNPSPNPPPTDPNPKPETEPLRPPAEWCQRCLRCMEKEPTIRCVLSPRSPRGKCIRCCNTHGTCEPIPQQCADLARVAVSASLDFCANPSPLLFDRLINAVSAVRVEMRKYPTPETPKGPGRLPASGAATAAATPATPAIATVNGPAPPTIATVNGPSPPTIASVNGPSPPPIATVNGPPPSTAPANGPSPTTAPANDHDHGLSPATAPANGPSNGPSPPAPNAGAVSV